MIIAEQKLKENIAEYLIYMYQVEDLIRANDFDLARIEQTIINKFEVGYDVKREMLEWYKSLVDAMLKEGKQKTGHLNFLEKITAELMELQLKLLHDPLNSEIRDVFSKANADMEALRSRSGQSKENDVQLAMNGLYAYLILRLQKKEISKETKEAFASITEWIALLSSEYMKTRDL